jgi:RNA 3'-terminal phosphate cyclase (ATP)
LKQLAVNGPAAGNAAVIEIDGSLGEGGGQILRTALGLSIVAGKPFRLFNLRARRRRPGLLAQHLTAVNAATAISGAAVEGAQHGSLEICFQPGPATPGDYAFDIGTAGSTTLVLQTLLPPLMLSAAPSTVRLEGGTHNPMAPPCEFLVNTFLPLVGRMGSRVGVKLDRHGFYPAGGGKLRVTIQPCAALRRLDLCAPPEVRSVRALAVVANLPQLIAERELAILKRELHLRPDALRIEHVDSPGPGNFACVEVECGELTEVFTGFGERGVRAEVVAERLAGEVRRFLDASVPVGEHLADQLLLPVALAGGGSFVAQPLSPHATTNLEVIRRFLPVSILVQPLSPKSVRVEVATSPD